MCPPGRLGAGRKEARYSWAGVGSPGELRYAAPHKGTLSLACAENSRALAEGDGRPPSASAAWLGDPGQVP